MKQEVLYQVPLPVEVNIKGLQLGAGHPLLIQSMANTDTKDIRASSKQLIKLIKAGSQLVRFTTQGLKEVEALREIRNNLSDDFSEIPLVADVHFNAKVAFEAAKICDKVRINPGNFTEKNRGKNSFTVLEFDTVLQKNKEQFRNLINICSENNTALRIGVNHGSLSNRIVSRYGNTPLAMVESALEFLRFCKEENFSNVVVSLKASNTRLMIQSVRLLVKHMLDEDLYYPLHLGVTESGDGLEGRIKSVVGLAPLLLEGMGDTIRVSLTEPPENELPVANLIRKLFPKPNMLPYNPFEKLPWDPFAFQKRAVNAVGNVGGTNPPCVISSKDNYEEPLPDIQVSWENKRCKLITQGQTQLLSDWSEISSTKSRFILVDNSVSPEIIASKPGLFVICLDAAHAPMTEIKSWIISYDQSGGNNPIILRKKYYEKNMEKYAIKAAGEYALFLIDGLLNGIWIENAEMTNHFNKHLSYNILQASRNRITSTEYIACPSCGRTLFDIESVLQEVRFYTSHLKHLKIAVMGCIVNGPGEMADADYGYVGSGKNLVTIYKGRIPVKKNVPAQDAIQSLIHVINENGDWIKP